MALLTLPIGSIFVLAPFVLALMSSARKSGALSAEESEAAARHARQRDDTLALGRLALLAIAADGHITDAEWSELLRYLIEHNVAVRREDLVAELGCPIESLANPAVLEAKVRALRPQFGKEGLDVALDVLRRMTAIGATMPTHADYRRNTGDPTLLVQRFTQWLTD